MPSAKIVKGETYSIVSDYLGTPCLMYNHIGNLVWQAELDIYGKIRTLERGSLQDCPFRYQGQYEDAETGLYYNRFRYYSPESGTYISQDPIGLKGNNPNIYAYVWNANYQVDVFGLAVGDRNNIPRIEQGNLKEGWEHIDARHITGNHPNGTGDLFEPGTSRQNLENAARKIIKKGKRVTVDITRRMQTFEMKIKIQGNKKRTSSNDS
ncbi:RHS repeat-associated core domain-containing protein [Rapidithrix thailandica]|uniref:RHS repeat-associated core domain-containing protein n=1 Tax=Rapidithrix thailandica TaxID=413964 RepID=A0AAW9S7U6_9BACT